MDKKSKILIFIFFASLLVSIFMTYKRTMVDKNFDIENSTPLESVL